MDNDRPSMFRQPLAHLNSEMLNTRPLPEMCYPHMAFLLNYATRLAMDNHIQFSRQAPRSVELYQAHMGASGGLLRNEYFYNCREWVSAGLGVDNRNVMKIVLTRFTSGMVHIADMVELLHKKGVEKTMPSIAAMCHVHPDSLADLIHGDNYLAQVDPEEKRIGPKNLTEFGVHEKSLGCPVVISISEEEDELLSNNRLPGKRVALQMFPDLLYSEDS